MKSDISVLSNSTLKEDYKNTSTIKKPDHSKYDDLIGKITSKLLTLDSMDNTLAVNRMLHKALEEEVAELESYDFSEDGIECPSCNERFISSPSGSVKIEQLKERHLKKTEEKKVQLAKTVTDINSAGNTRAKRQEVNDLKTKIDSKIRTENDAYDLVVNSRSEIKAKLMIQQNTLDTLSEKLEKQESFISQISEIDSILTKASTKLSMIDTEIELASTIASILSPTGAPAYIVDTVVDIFNEKVSSYVAMIWPNASYRLQSFKENKDGGVKAKFSDKLVIGGRDISIGSLSGGEFRCLSVSVDFAVIDVVESMFGFSISPVFLDEPFEGLDTSNRERVINLLEQLSSDRQIWIIDHASEAKSMFSKTVRIEKENGISSIISQEA